MRRADVLGATLLALTAWSCAPAPREAVEDARDEVVVTVDPAVPRRGMFPPSVPGVRVTVTNRGATPRGFYGLDGEEPVTRLAVRDGARWVEREPLWLECGTGLGDGTLAPGASATCELSLPAIEGVYRVGVGTWPADAPSPDWRGWRWSWSAPVDAASLPLGD